MSQKLSAGSDPSSNSRNLSIISSGSRSSVRRKKPQKPEGSIDSFWAEHPRLLQFKSLFDGAIELGFLIKAAYVIHEDRDLTCQDTKWNETFDTERIRLCLDLMIFLHTLHICRLIFGLYNKYSKKSNACQGCLRCLLLDCYCCAGTIVYLYTQISFFIDLGDCTEDLPHIEPHMRHEIIYQYARIVWYFLTNLMVVLYIIAI